MKRFRYVLPALLCALTLLLPASAARAVPGEVLRSTESVVRILAEYPDYYSTGSGFAVKAEEDCLLIATNCHVVEGEPYSISVWVSDEETVDAEILIRSEEKDLCILEIREDLELVPLELQEDDGSVGEAIYAVGFPGAADDLTSSQAHTSKDATITDGIISAVRTDTMPGFGIQTKILQINAAINPGNSGGPLFNEKGQVVGINTYGILDSQGIFGAIAISELITYMEDNGISVLPEVRVFPYMWAVAGVLMGLSVLIPLLKIIASGRRKRKDLARQAQHTEAVHLRQLMQFHPYGLGMEDAASLLLPAAQSLQQLHSTGKVHLNLCPDSVWLNGNHQVNLEFPEATGMYAPGFAAPEQMEGGQIYYSTDVYTFGAILLYAATGTVFSAPPTPEELDRFRAPAGCLSGEAVELFRAMLNPAPQARISQMETVVQALLPYARNPQGVWQRQGMPQPPAEPAKKYRSNGFWVGTGAVCLVLSFLLSYGAGWGAARLCAENGRAELSPGFLMLPQVTQMHDPDLTDYLEGLRLMRLGEARDARKVFAGLGSYLDAREQKQEADYRYAQRLVASHKFEKALEIFRELEEEDYRDAADRIPETQFREAEYLLEQEKTEQALEILENLAQEGYEPALEALSYMDFYQVEQLIEDGDYLGALELLQELDSSLLEEEPYSDLVSFVYEEGCQSYWDGDYEYAMSCFQATGDYEDAENYLILLQARSEYCADPAGLAQAMLEMLDFEDTAELILSRDDLASVYLLGVWKSADESYYFTMDEDYDTTYNLPWFEFGDVYGFAEGQMYLYPQDDPSDTRVLYTFTVVDADTVEVQCAKDGSLITLYRQA